MIAESWQIVGGRTGIYTRLRRPDQPQREASLMVPLDRTAGDYLDLMTSVVLTLRDTAQLGQRAAGVLYRLNSD